MADNTETMPPIDEPGEPDREDQMIVPLPPIAAPEASTVGDENMEVREPTVDVRKEEVPAQVMGQPAPAVDVVPVHETHIDIDTVIIDTSDPLAVQIPDAGRGDASLPIHAAAGPTVEQFFDKHGRVVE